MCVLLHKESSEPDQRASRTTAIKAEVRAVKQLDDGIDDTFVSSVREEVSFPLIDFTTSWMEKSHMPQA